MEVWKDIVGYEGKYQVSSYGRVKSLERKVWNRYQFVTKKERILKKRYNHKGYVAVILYLNNSSKSYMVHRLVAMHFIDNPEHKTQVNHKNGCKEDNRVQNLEWVTGSENQRHAFDLGLYDTRIKKQKDASKPVMMMSVDGEPLFVFQSIHEANDYFGVKDSHIYAVCCNRRNVALGYRWQYITKDEYKKLRNQYSDLNFKRRDLSRTPIDVFNQDHQLINSFSSIREASDYFGISRKIIFKCCNKESGLINGYIFRYHDFSRKDWRIKYDALKKIVNK